MATTVQPQPRHAATIRVTHWITALCFLALLVSGIEIVISHPRFYWGETGNMNTEALFQLPIPSSRATVKTGYDYVLSDQNGWSRYLHFQSAWVVVFVGLSYLGYGLASGHFRDRLLPSRSNTSWSTLWAVTQSHLRLRPTDDDPSSYNPLQRLAYASVVFVLFPLVIWTGLAMSPAFVGAVPTTVTLLGGHQSARTIHFFLSIALLVFLVVHVTMVLISGPRARMRAMISGDPPTSKPTAREKT